MDLGVTLGLIGFALLAIALARVAHERRLDRKSADAALGRFHSLEGSRQYQLVSSGAC